MFYLWLYIVVSGIAVAIMYYEEEDPSPLWVHVAASLALGWFAAPLRIAEIVLEIFKPLK